MAIMYMIEQLNKYNITYATIPLLFLIAPLIAYIDDRICTCSFFI